MKIIWIGSRCHNQGQLKLFGFKQGLKIRGNYGTEKVGTAHFTVNQIRGFHDTKCVFQCVQNGRMGGIRVRELEQT